MIEYNKVEKGDTLVMTDAAPHYLKAGATKAGAPPARPPMYGAPGDVLIIEKVMPAGIVAKNKLGKRAEFCFEHGALKLSYTPETEKRIAERAQFAADEAAEEARRGDPIAQMSIVQGQMSDMMNVIKSQQRQIEQLQGGGQGQQLQQQQRPPQTATKEQAEADVADMTGKLFPKPDAGTGEPPKDVNN
jgi:hypothetical protein